jgi:hypothetical protein
MDRTSQHSTVPSAPRCVRNKLRYASLSIVFVLCRDMCRCVQRDLDDFVATVAGGGMQQYPSIRVPRLHVRLKREQHPDDVIMSISYCKMPLRLDIRSLP